MAKKDEKDKKEKDNKPKPDVNTRRSKSPEEWHEVMV